MLLRIPRLFKHQPRPNRRGLAASSSLERLLWSVLPSAPAVELKKEVRPKKRFSFAGILFVALFFAQVLHAAEPAAESAKIFYPSEHASVSMTPGISAPGAHAPIATSIIYLVCLGGMGYVAYVLWRRKIVPQKTQAQKSVTLDVTTTRPLGNRQFLVVVRYNNQDLLLGVGQGFITRLDASSTPVTEPTPDFSDFENLAYGAMRNDKEVTLCKK